MGMSKAQKALKSGPSKVGAKARAAASALRGAGAQKAPETRHLQTQQFGGKHHAPSAQGAKKNAYGSMSDPSIGRHSLSNGQVGRRGSYSREKDVAGAYKSSVGSGYTGKHRKPGA